MYLLVVVFRTLVVFSKLILKESIKDIQRNDNDIVWYRCTPGVFEFCLDQMKRTWLGIQEHLCLTWVSIRDCINQESKVVTLFDDSIHNAAVESEHSAGWMRARLIEYE